MSALLYFDASALVKAYVREEYSEEAVAFLSLAPNPITSALSGSEVPAALCRLLRSGVLSEQAAGEALEQFWREWRSAYVLVPLDADLAAQGGELSCRHGLRGMDGAHLAAAQWARNRLGRESSVGFVTYDLVLWRAAGRAGFEALPPDLEERRDRSMAAS